MLRKMEKNEFEVFHQLLEDNFPKSERRLKHVQKRLLDLDSYNVFVETDGDDIVGFFAEWSSEAFRFVEHLAVNQKYRGSGTGSRLLKEYHDLSDVPVILEVEPPEDDIQQRRVKFYERNGYHLTPFGYMQPTLYEGETPIPLVLMSYPDRMTEAEFNTFKTWSHTTIYHPDNK
ncbi:GNAT family N-acetyltransferase [Corticicoccus populi]|uniref:GNAT family N-acetyltransferase n=1 Tax=Corticicoccus populi TaxID=1812821 RepID=A0ABW5WRV2_9STAP